MTAKVLLPVSVAAFLSFLSPASCFQAQPPEARATQSQERTAGPQSTPRPREPLTPRKSALRILYAGYPDSPRGRDFVSFLTPFFHEVKAVNVLEFNEKAATGYSVIMIDNHRWSLPDPVRPRLSQAYSRPTMTIGVPGSWLCGDLRLKTGYS